MRHCKKGTVLRVFFFILFDLFQNMLSFAFRFLLIQAFWEGLVDGFSYCFLSFLATFPCLANVWFSRSWNQKAALGSADANLINWKSPWVSMQIRVNSAAKDHLNPNKFNAYDMTASFEIFKWTFLDLEKLFFIPATK